MDFISKEVSDVKDRLIKIVECSQIISCNRQLVQVKIV